MRSPQRWNEIILILLGILMSSNAFLSQRRKLTEPPRSLGMSNFFDDIGNFFNNMGNGSNNNKDDCMPTSMRLIEISADRIKPGGLRLFLMLYLMGMQNIPDRRSWSVDQPIGGYAIDCHFHDRSAALMIRLTNDTLTVDRKGLTPSMSYMIQESVIVNGILDELSTCAFNKEVADGDRLLLLSDPKDAIERARESLAFQ